MKLKVIIFKLFCVFYFCLFSNNGFSQSNDYKDVEYTVLAEGTDSPIENLQIVCFNKFFNKDYLPPDFREKYKLDDKSLYKKQMLIEIFRTNSIDNGLDKIHLKGIKESQDTLIIEYNFINSNEKNDRKKLSPFLIVQIPKSKKEVKFVVDGSDNKSMSEIYIDN
ncbi:hypothetical protein K1F50_19890 [Muricauda oceani]|uniref:DUF4738 domain-containing protein n=1 Tax=Flagellimonas oceani TaxID=2698672 RepID=A0A6G7J1V3_9FLAO|nr:hypothetical protein [Allomuricauda oceani]MBW8245077.1 hypothetical protein [Allomuricauda oceani]QII44851.1 hypothetical protein GVT53_09200 [Allomuricauda oceani]